MQALPFIAIGAKAFGSVLQGIGGYKAGKYNRKVANANARSTLAEGAEQETRIRNASRIALGRQVGAQAESGFEIGTGSAIDSLLESATNAELDAMDVRRQAASRAASLRSQGALAYAEGRNQLISGLVGAAGSVASGFSDYATANK